MTKKDVTLTNTLGDLSQSELMDFIYCLNNNMKDYDSDIDSAMERADKAEWDSLKATTHKGVNIQYAGSRR